MHDINSVPSNVQSASHEALLYVFEDNEAVIKMIMKGRSPTMRHVSRTHRVALDWLFDRINLDPKIQIKYIDTKNQLADILTKGNFTRGEWNHLLTLFNISHFSSTSCIAAMAKRAQQESGEGRVTAKSRPMMNLTARTPSFVSSSGSSNPGRTRMDLKILKDMFLTIERGNPLKCQDQTIYKRIMVRQKRMSSIAEDCTEHSIIWGMFMATTLNAATFMGKNYSTMQNVVKNEESLTLKQMFDVTAQMVHNEEEIYCLDKILYQKNSWTKLSLINDPVIINLQSTKVYVFSDSVLCLGKVLQHPECNEAWKNRVAGVRAEMNYRDYDAINGEPTEFEWNIFPGFNTL